MKNLLELIYIRLVRPSLEFFLLIPGLPGVLLVRIIRPFVWIRFGSLRSKVLGNSAIDLECYSSIREIEKSHTLDFFYFQTQTLPNEQWALMVRRCIKVHPIAKYFDSANQILPGGKAHHIQTIPEGRHSFAFRGVLNRIKKPHISFTEEENIRGRKFLKQIGLKKGDRFICLIVRNSAYKDKFQKYGATYTRNKAYRDGDCKKKDWSYHSYRDSDIDTYEQAAMTLAKKGYWIFRMGKGVNKPFRGKHQQIHDYASSNYRCDFLDIWLMANCYFTISTGCGLDAISEIFRRPIVFVNFPVIGLIHSYLDHQITITKKLRYIANGRYLSLNDQIRNGSIFFMRTELYSQTGLEIIDNSPEEINEAVLELEARMNGTWKEVPGNLQLQNKFWKILKGWERFPEYFPPDLYRKFSGSHDEIRCKIGAAFLKKNHEWLLE